MCHSRGVTGRHIHRVGLGQARRDVLEAVAGDRNVKRFRGGLVFKAHRLFYHSTLGLRVIKKKKVEEDERAAPTFVSGYSFFYYSHA